MALDNQVFLVENLVDQASITPSTVNAQYPTSNLKDARRTKTFRSTNDNTTIVFDFIIPKSINICALVDSGMEAFQFEAATIELNNTNTWGSPAVSVPLSIDVENGFAYASLDQPYSFRYARLILTGTAGYCEVSKLFIGETVQAGILSFNYPLSFQVNDNATVTRNRLGQKFIDEINLQREISGSISTMTKEEFQPIFDMVKYASITRPIWLIFPEGCITEDNDQVNGYYYLKNEPRASLVAGNFWNISLTFEEGT